MLVNHLSCGVLMLQGKSHAIVIELLPAFLTRSLHTSSPCVYVKCASPWVCASQCTLHGLASVQVNICILSEAADPEESCGSIFIRIFNILFLSEFSVWVYVGFILFFPTAWLRSGGSVNHSLVFDFSAGLPEWMSGMLGIASWATWCAWQQCVRVEIFFFFFF